jgi:hypothetical protein
MRRAWQHSRLHFIFKNHYSVVRCWTLEGIMDGLVYVLELLIAIVALFALLRLFSISNDLRAIREHICSGRGSADSAASAAKSGSGPQGI